MTQFGALHPVRELGRHNQNPDMQHVRAVRHLVKWIYHNKYSIRLRPSDDDRVISIWTDASLNGGTVVVGSLVMFKDTEAADEAKEEAKGRSVAAEAHLQRRLVQVCTWLLDYVALISCRLQEKATANLGTCLSGLELSL